MKGWSSYIWVILVTYLCFFITKNKELLSFNYLKFQAQYSYTVVETLMSHLDDNSKSDPKIRTSIADVLSKIIATAAGESVGK